MIDSSDLKDFEDWIRFTLEMLIEDPDKLELEVKIFNSSGTTVRVTVKAPRNEAGKIFGKGKMTLLALRRLAFPIIRRIGADRLDLYVLSDDESIPKSA